MSAGDEVSGYFTHLHVRSGYSWGFGTATPDEIAAAAAELGMDAAALTDRDTLFGAPRFLAACSEHGMSSVVGAEITLEGGGHLVLLVEDGRGYRSLCRLITSYRCSSADRRKPECPLDEVLEHAEGLVCLTGAVPFGFAPRMVLSGMSGRTRIGDLRDAFGEDGLFVELTNDMTAGGRRRVREVHEFARSRGLRSVATNEVAYVERRDHRLHEVLSAASSLSALPPPGYRPTDQLYLKSARKMARLFEGCPDALRNVREIAERCSGAVGVPASVHMPSAAAENGESAEKRLVRLAVAGARRRYGRESLPEVMNPRLKHVGLSQEKQRTHE